MQDLQIQDRQQDIGLKRLYAKAMLAGLGLQVALADAGFFYYQVVQGGRIPADVLEVWLGATVVEVVSVVLVITRYLFPQRDEAHAP